MILLDKLFSPKPKRYNYADLQVNIAEKYTETIIVEGETPEEIEDDYASFFAAYQDSLIRLGIEQRVHQLGEVNVSARRITNTQEIFHNRSTSVAYYDVASEYDDLYDSGDYISDDLHQMLLKMNHKFSITEGYSVATKGGLLFIRGVPSMTLSFSQDAPTINLMDSNEETLTYNSKFALVVVNNKPIDISIETEYFEYKQFGLRAIKNIYVNENLSALLRYIIVPPNISEKLVFIAKMFSCVVFIETYPDGEIPVEGARGVRKTWLDGYSQVSEFYNPDYSSLSPASDIADYRRTLYWNPMVTTDENGIAKIEFYNNSRSRNFSISAETATQQGMIGIYKNE